MTATNQRAQLSQKLDQLPPEILAVVIEFVDFLLRRYEKPLSPPLKDSPNTNLSDLRSGSLAIQSEDADIRPPIDDHSLLDITETWEGSDFEECLQTGVT